MEALSPDLIYQAVKLLGARPDADDARRDAVDLDDGATMGPHSVVLPAASIGADATVGPASLVMRGEHVPARTRWAGNPIAPWPDPDPQP